MGKWADYLLTSVSYGPDRSTIERVVVRADLGGVPGPAETWTRAQLVRAIAAGVLVCTARKQFDGAWVLGEHVTVTLDEPQKAGAPALRRRDSCLSLPEARLAM